MVRVRSCGRMYSLVHKEASGSGQSSLAEECHGLLEVLKVSDAELFSDDGSEGTSLELR